jgi:hypothetical protein
VTFDRLVDTLAGDAVSPQSRLTAAHAQDGSPRASRRRSSADRVSECLTLPS